MSKDFGQRENPLKLPRLPATIFQLTPIFVPSNHALHMFCENDRQRTRREPRNDNSQD
jgi:hypothetical protein